MQLLYEYDRWANGKVFEAASALSSEQFTQNLGGAFPSVRDTLLHIIAGEWIWLQYWKAESLNMSFATDLEKHRNFLFRAELFQTLAAVREKWAEVEREQTEFVEAMSDE